MAGRKLIVFKHDNALGSAQAQKLFDRVTVSRCFNGDSAPVRHPSTHNWPPARAFSDYEIKVDRDGLPDGVDLVEPF